MNPFADLLSVLETRERDATGAIRTEPMLRLDPTRKLRTHEGLAERLVRLLVREGGALGFPANAAVVGTVNMDETTHPFSRKVLDRAFCMEFADVDLSASTPPRREPAPPLAVRASDLASPPLSPGEIAAEFPDLLPRLNGLLGRANEALRATSMQVAWRARDEMLRYLYWNRREELLSEPVALDLAFHHKILPRLQGGDEMRAGLEALAAIATENGLTQSAGKLERMRTRLDTSGFTAFWA